MYKTLFLFVLIIFSGCSNMVFHPDSHVYRTPDKYELLYQDIDFTSSDGTMLHGWWLKPQTDSKGLMVVVHGNAQNLSAHFVSWVWLVEAGYELFIFDYRGYGKSEGEEELDKVIEDTTAALHYAREHYEGDLYVSGQSLGGVLLTNALAREPYPRYKLAIIDSCYSDLEEMGKDVLSRSFITWPFQWVSYLVLTDEYNPIDRVGKIDVPMLFIAGSKDAIIPPNNSWQLFDAASRPKEFWLVNTAGHTNAMNNPTIQRDLLEYLKAIPVEPDYSALKIYDNLDKITKKNRH